MKHDNVIYFNTRELELAKQEYLGFIIENDLISHFNSYQQVQIIFEIAEVKTLKRLSKLKLKLKEVLKST